MYNPPDTPFELALTALIRGIEAKRGRSIRDQLKDALAAYEAARRESQIVAMANELQKCLIFGGADQAAAVWATRLWEAAHAS